MRTCLWATPDDLGSLDNKYLHETKRRITDEGYHSCGTTIAPGYSVILSTRAPIGHVAISMDYMCCNQGCRILIPKENILSDYLYYLFYSAESILDALGQGSTFKELNRDKLLSFELPLPSMEEQHSITAFIDIESTSIDVMNSKLKHSITLLHEYRKSLINSAVIGKIDLRDYNDEL